MSLFLTRLDVYAMDAENASGVTWKLAMPFMYESSYLGDKTIVVPIGFETDFASVPRLPFVYMLLGDTAHKAAVLHDYLYTTKEHSRYASDRVFYEAARLSGMPMWKAWMLFIGVRLGGWKVWDKR